MFRWCSNNDDLFSSSRTCWIWSDCCLILAKKKNKRTKIIESIIPKCSFKYESADIILIQHAVHSYARTFWVRRFYSWSGPTPRLRLGGAVPRLKSEASASESARARRIGSACYTRGVRRACGCVCASEVAVGRCACACNEIGSVYDDRTPGTHADEHKSTWPRDRDFSQSLWSRFYCLSTSSSLLKIRRRSADERVSSSATSWTPRLRTDNRECRNSRHDHLRREREIPASRNSSKTFGGEETLGPKERESSCVSSRTSRHHYTRAGGETVDRGRMMWHAREWHKHENAKVDFPLSSLYLVLSPIELHWST